MKDFQVEQRKAMLFILALAILALGLGWIKRNMHENAECVLNIEQVKAESAGILAPGESIQQVISINSSDINELCLLTGIGEVKAGAAQC